MPAAEIAARPCRFCWPGHVHTRMCIQDHCPLTQSMSTPAAQNYKITSIIFAHILQVRDFLQRVRSRRFPPIESDMRMVLAHCGSLLLDPAALHEVRGSCLICGRAGWRVGWGQAGGGC